jgi:predicted ribosomally synthesized peptide with nif11-like leader
MSLQQALQFIQLVRSDETLRARLEPPGHVDLGALVNIAREQGYAMTEDELRRAFTHDWAMRWLRYRGSD